LETWPANLSLWRLPGAGAESEFPGILFSTYMALGKGVMIRDYAAPPATAFKTGLVNSLSRFNYGKLPLFAAILPRGRYGSTNFKEKVIFAQNLSCQTGTLELYRDYAAVLATAIKKWFWDVSPRV